MLPIWNVIKPRLTTRWVVMVYSLLAAAGRLGLTQLTSPRSAAKINVLPGWVYGLAFLFLFGALAWTLERRRWTVAGLVTSVFGVGVYMVQAFDVWPVLPSSAYYLLMANVLMVETAVIWSMRRHVNH